MSFAENTAAVRGRTTLASTGIRAFSVQGVLLALAAFLLPAAAHLTGTPVRLVLPMHWPVILAGLVYGWRAGLLVGAAAPTVSYLLSGMPLPAVLPAMTLELAAYGFLAGLLRQRFHWNGFLCATAALAGGRLVFLAVAASAGVALPTFSTYVKAAILPGLPAAVAQLVSLPPLAAWWVRHERKS